MATTEDDGIEILSCHIEHDDDTTEHSASVSLKIANGGLPDDPVTRQRKRVARAVGIVTFILLLFSIVLIGVSLNMSKNIDEMGKSLATSPFPRHTSRYHRSTSHTKRQNNRSFIITSTLPQVTVTSQAP